ncbi:MAG TPA: DUF3488 and transglutaminase-like domain-containing protein [Azospira sp.]|nr:DUF3488 and transglutaminase-like domain-containing protein [Azospira sp.]
MSWRRQQLPRRAPPPLPPAIVPWLLASAIATAGPHALHQPLWLTAFAGLILGWRGWLWWRQQASPPRWALLLLACAGIAAIVSEYRTLFGREAGVGLLVLFLALKLMELKSRRDGVVALMLGYFLLLTHYFHSQSIPTGLWMLLALVVVTAALLRLHGDAGASPQASLRHAGRLLLQALPFMLVLYLLFPRISGPLWGLPQDAHAGLSGLSDTMAPGSLSNLIQNGSIAFRVQFDGPVPPRSRLYWRGPVLDFYDGTVWRPRFLPDRRPARVEVLGPETAYVTTLEAHNQRWLLALDSPTALPPDSERGNDLQVLARQPVTSRNRYTFRSALAYRHNPEERPDILQRALQLPAQRNPRTRELAARWQQETPNPEQLIGRALTLFREEQFFYTLRPPLLGPEAMDEFLFATRRGFCEHYASAFVVLMRAAGLPARVVTGYQGGEINPVDGYLTVRHSDAHAWAEVWLAGEGWRRMDPTAAIAPARVESGIAAALPEGEFLPVLARVDLGWLVQLRNRWEATNNAWNQWVLGYNPVRQKELLSRLGMQDPDWRSMAAALAASIGLLLLGLTLWSLGRRPRLAPEERLWRQFCARAGRPAPSLRKAEWEGPLAYGARVARALPSLAAVAEEASGLYATLRYGPPLAPADRQLLLKRLAACIRRLPSRRFP